MGGGGGVGVSGSMVSRKQPEDVERVRFRMAWLYEFGIRNLEGVLVPEWCIPVFRIGGNGGGYAHLDLEDEDESLPSVIIIIINSIILVKWSPGKQKQISKK